VAAGIVVLVCAAGALALGQVRHQLLDRQQRELAVKQALIEGKLRSAASDLLFLSNHNELQGFIKYGEKFVDDKLANDFLAFLASKRIYAQARYIDTSEHEVVNVRYSDGMAVRAMAQPLQPGSFDIQLARELATLPLGEIYVSDMQQLRVEHGAQVEATPVVYLATPLVGLRGQRFGGVVLTYLADDILDALAPEPGLNASIDQTDYLLLNKEGYFLKGLRSEQEWGFTLPDPAMRGQLTMGAIYPQAWARLENRNEGQTSLAAGMFSQATLNPAQVAAQVAYLAREEVGKVEAGDLSQIPEPSYQGPCWRLLTYLPRRAVQLAYRSTYWLASGALVLGLALAGALAWMLAQQIERRALADLAVKQANTQLQATVAQLDEALAEAQAATKAKSEFLATMSHEIRTPMNGITGMLQVLLHTPLSPDQQDYARTIDASANSLLKIINDILDFSKIEAGKLEIETIDFDLRQVVEDTAELMAAKAHGKGLELAVMIEPGTPLQLLGDPGRLRQVVGNLLNNAIKFTERGQVAVHAACVFETERVARIRLEVRDTGIGIPKDKQSRLFQSFTQVDASTTRRFGGTGLGLAICLRLIQLMGGEIGLESEEDRGSTFWLEVPLAKQAGSLQSPVISDEQFHNLPVLVVDDNVLNQRILKLQLESWGCKPRLASSGREALRLLEAGQISGQPYRIAILDYMMPGMDGAELARRIKGGLAADSPALVLLTSALHSDAELMRGAGFQAFLAKPVKQSTLFNCLANILGVEREARPSLAARPCESSLSPQEAAMAKLLLVEDNQVNQLVALNLLKLAGFTADVASNGAEAVVAVQAQPYDLVLMDMQMPVLDGLEATERIRALGGEYASLPIVAMTANAMQGDRERCLAAGMNDYLSKPINTQELMCKIDKFVTVKLLARMQPAAAAASEPAGQAWDGRVSVRAGANGGQAAAPVQEAGAGAADVPLDIPASIERAGSPDFWRELVEVYITETGMRLEELKQALDDQDAGRVAREAHTIKGSSAELLAEPARAIAYELELAGRSCELGHAPELVEQLEQEFSRLREYLAHSTN
jgi:signal transduction histidine kinase/CheY-like chemotaxis protein